MTDLNKPNRDANGKLIDPETGQPFADQSKAESDLRRAEEITDRETTDADTANRQSGAAR